MSDAAGVGRPGRRVVWVDANVLLRFLTGEPPEMADRSEELLRDAEGGEVTVRVHPVVVAEVVWVLQSFYERPKEDIAGALVPLLTGHGLKTQDRDTVTRALRTMAAKNVDFADALLAETARAKEESVASFDRDFDKLGVTRWQL